MHEVGLAEAILDAVQRRAAGRRVSAVKVRIGALHRAVGPAMDSAFELVSAGTVAHDARMELVVVPVCCRCRSCGAETRSDEMLVVCPQCGAAALELTAGDELTLESITVAPDYRADQQEEGI